MQYIPWSGIKQTLSLGVLAAGLVAATLAGAEPKTISLGFSGGQVLPNGAVMAAEPEFEQVAQKFGATVDYRNFGTGVDSLSALVTDSINWVVTGATEVVKASTAQRDMVAVFNLYQGGAVVLVGAKKYEAERGRDVGKYAGSTWAYTREGSLSQIYMQAVAESAGVKWGEQNRITIGTVTAFLPTLQSGRADIVAMDPTAAAKAVGLGIGYAVFNTNERARVEPIWGDQIGSVLATTRKFLESYPELSAALVVAQLKGFLAFRGAANDPAKGLALMPADFRSKNSEYFAEQWGFMAPAFTAVDGTFTSKAIDDTIKISLKNGTLTPDEKVDPSRFDNSLTEAAYKTLGLPKPPIQ